MKIFQKFSNRVFEKTLCPPVLTDRFLSDIATPAPSGGLQLHGSAAAFQGQGVLVFGPSGSGKSSIILGLLAFGAVLVSDDTVHVIDGPCLAAPQDGAVPAIEARGIGLLYAEIAPGPVPLALAVSLAEAEPDRLPPSRHLDCGDARVPLILAAGHPNLAPVLLQYLRKGRFR